VCGLDHDLKTMGGNVDKMRRDLTQFLAARIGTEFALCIGDRVEDVDGMLCWVVTVKHAPGPAYVQGQDTKKFYVREGPSTADLDVEASHRYIKNKWGWWSVRHRSERPGPSSCAATCPRVTRKRRNSPKEGTFTSRCLQARPDRHHQDPHPLHVRHCNLPATVFEAGIAFGRVLKKRQVIRQSSPSRKSRRDSTRDG